MMRLLLMRSFLCCLSPPPLKAALAASSLLACMVSPIPAVVVASSHLCDGLVAPFPFHWLSLVPNKYQKDAARWEPMPSPGAHTGTKPEFVSENSTEKYFRQDEFSSFNLMNIATWTPDHEYGGTVFENHRKSLIQHCERSELRLHFEWTKVN